MKKRYKLKRALGLPLIVLFGLGNILGAGIYVLVGEVAGFSGMNTVLAFIIAMIVAAFTAFSYIEFSGRYPVSAGASIYVYEAFKKKWFSLLIGLAMVAGGIASAGTLALGFAGYLNSLTNIPIVVGSVALICLIGVIALKGVGESAKIASIFTVIEALGLILIIWFGREALGTFEASQLITIDPKIGFGGIIAGAFLAFYAFLGFEAMANLAEESENPRRTMPLAIIIALAAATFLYLLVVIVATGIVPTEELAESQAPLTLVFERSGAQNAIILTFIGMMATINGIILQIIMASRVLYGLAKKGWLHNSLTEVHHCYKTPTLATIIVTSAIVIGTLLLPLVSLAQLTSLIILGIFASVNISLVVIKKRKVENSSYVSVPIIVPCIGALLCLSMILYQLYLWL